MQRGSSPWCSRCKLLVELGVAGWVWRWNSVGEKENACAPLTSLWTRHVALRCGARCWTKCSQSLPPCLLVRICSSSGSHQSIFFWDSSGLSSPGIENEKLNSSKCWRLSRLAPFIWWFTLRHWTARWRAQLPVFFPVSTSMSASTSSVLWISSDQICVVLIEGKQCFSTKLKYLLKVSAFTTSVTGSQKKARVLLATEAIWQFIVWVSAALIRARSDQIEFTSSPVNEGTIMSSGGLMRFHCRPEGFLLIESDL